MSWVVLVDGVVALLLAATIVCALVLNRRIDALRRDRSELERATAALTDSLARTEEATRHLRVSADELVRHIDAAKTANDELSFIVERADALAGKLEHKVRTLRAAGAKSGGAHAGGRPVAEKLKSALDHPPATEVERELLRALATGR